MRFTEVRECIDEIGHRFSSQPLSFLTESDLKMELTWCLRQRESRGSPDPDIHICRTTRYKKKYIQLIADSSLRSAVHTEVNLAKKGENFYIDISVFKKRVKGVIDKGTKRFEPDNLDHAIEIKFIKNKNNVGIGYFDTEIDKFENKLDKSTAKYLAVFSNKNVFQGRGRGPETKKELEHKGFELFDYYPGGCQ